MPNYLQPDRQINPDALSRHGGSLLMSRCCRTADFNNEMPQRL